jgi:hypothetical protein
MNIREALACATLPVPVAGAVFFGLSRNGSYDAARRGDLPTIKMGRKILVPTALVAARLGLPFEWANRQIAPVAVSVAGSHDGEV